MRAFDWLLRTVMLALAGLVTLSILGAIDAASNRGGPGGFIAERIEAPAPEAGPDERAAVEREPQRAPGGNASVVAGEASAVARPDEEPGRWLEAIAYALLAVAGLLAIALLLLWSAARDVRRIADSLSERGR